MRRFAAIATVVLLVAATAADALGRRPPPPFRDLPRSQLVVETASGSHAFTVWIAADDASRERGLMFVREMDPKHGMLFLFERPYQAAFWMKDTWLSLDLIFIAADGRVVNVAANVPAGSLEPIFAAAPVKAVLEVVAGTALRIGLEPGGRVLHPALGGQAPP